MGRWCSNGRRRHNRIEIGGVVTAGVFPHLLANQAQALQPGHGINGLAPGTPGFPGDGLIGGETAPLPAVRIGTENQINRQFVHRKLTAHHYRIIHHDKRPLPPELKCLLHIILLSHK